MTHKSRWGFHPCDYETFLKLRRIHKAYHAGLILLARWRRWRAKMPHNRRGPEPVVPAVIREICAAPVAAAFNAARRPAPYPEAVQPLGIKAEQMERWLAALE